MAKKAQLSVETMIMYGMILLVALSVIGVLLYFNILDLGSYLPDKCDLGGSGDLKCEEMQYLGTNIVPTSGTIRLGIRNIGQKPISLLDVVVTDDDSVHFSGLKTGSGDYALVAIDDTHSLPPGEIASVEITVGNAIPGQVFRGTLRTTYKFKEGALNQTATGSMRTKASES